MPTLSQEEIDELNSLPLVYGPICRMSVIDCEYEIDDASTDDPETIRRIANKHLFAETIDRNICEFIISDPRGDDDSGGRIVHAFIPKSLRFDLIDRDYMEAEHDTVTIWITGIKTIFSRSKEDTEPFSQIL